MSKIFKLNDHEFLIFEDMITPPGNNFLVLKKGFYDEKNNVFNCIIIAHNYQDKQIYDKMLEKLILESSTPDDLPSSTVKRL